MRTAIYVDVLLVLNYIITALLVLCMTKLLGITTTRRKIVAAALLGSASSLTIFLPFFSFFWNIFSKLLISAAIVLAALPWYGWRHYVKGWLVFFAVNFFFAGVMLGIWMGLAPSGMLYYNGVVYFDIGALTLLLATVAAYLLLGLLGRLTRAGRVRGNECRATLYRGEKVCVMRALVDSGNSLCEPFSGIPVIVCSLDAVGRLLDEGQAEAIRSGAWQEAGWRGSFRVIPFASVGGKGALPAFRADRLDCEREGERYRTERVYVAVSAEPVGDGRYSAVLNPDLIGVKLQGGGVRG